MLNHIIKILIADDHELFRKGIISLLLSEEKIRIVGEANDGKDLIYKYFKLKPDLVITDISMPELSGMEAVSILSERDPDIKVIYLSMYGGEDYIYHCIKSGGSGLIHKNVTKQELLHAIDLVSEGNKYFGQGFSDEQIEKLIADYESHMYSTGFEEVAQLSSKEEEILLLIADGLTSNEIADKLYSAKRTVDTHRGRIMQKLKLNSFPELIKYAISYAAFKKKNS